MDLAIVVINYQRDRDALRAMRELLADASGNGMTSEGILCDNSGGIHTNQDDRFTIQHLDNVGYAAAANLGASTLSSEFILFATHEVRLIRGHIREIVNEMRANARIGVVGPVLRTGKEGRIFSTGIAMNGFRPVHLTEVPTNYHFVQRDFVDGSFWIVRRETWDAVGPMNESMFLYWEEVEWQHRMALAGWTCGVSASVEVESRPSSDIRRHYYLFRNKYRFISEFASQRRAAAEAAGDWLEVLARLLLRLATNRDPRDAATLLRLQQRAVRDWIQGKSGKSANDLS